MKKSLSINGPTIKSVYSSNQNIFNSIILILFILIIGEIVAGNFFTSKQIIAATKLASFTALFALCQMIVIAGGGGGLDLSIGNIASMTCVLSAKFMNVNNNEGLIIALLISMGVGLAVGLANGILSAYLKLPPLVVTLAVASMLQGLLENFSQHGSVSGQPAQLLKTISTESLGGVIPYLIILLIVVIGVVLFILNKTKIGMKLFGVGSNDTTVYLSGVNVKRVRLLSYVASGIIAGLVGLLLLGFMGTPSVEIGFHYVFPSVAATVVGGVSLQGGNGNYLGVVLGAIFLEIMTNLLVALGWGEAGKWLAFGVVLFVLLIIYLGNKQRR